MDKSRQGNPEPAQGLIIESPGLLRTRQRVVEFVVTLIFWALLVYFWQPLVSLFGWVHHSLTTSNDSTILSLYDADIYEIKMYFVILFVLLFAYFLWAKINQWRFQGKERRSTNVPVDIQAVAQQYGVEASTLSVWRQYRLMVVELDDTGKICSVDPGALSSRVQS